LTQISMPTNAFAQEVARYAIRRACDEIRERYHVPPCPNHSLTPR